MAHTKRGAANEWTGSHGDADGRRGGVVSACPTLVVASAVLALVEVGAFAVIEKDMGLGVGDSIQGDGGEGTRSYVSNVVVVVDAV